MDALTGRAIRSLDENGLPGLELPGSAGENTSVISARNEGASIGTSLG